MIIPFPPADSRPPACPACGTALSAEAGSCQSCGYAAAVYCARRHFDPPALIRWNDREGVFRPIGDTVTRLIEAMERRFPHIRLCIYADSLPADLDAGRFAEWFATHGRSRPHGPTDTRQPVVIVIDRGTAEAAVATASSLDAWIPPQCLQNVVNASQPWLRERNWTASLKALLEALRRSFNEIWSFPGSPGDRGTLAPPPGVPHFTVLPPVGETTP